MKWYDYDEFDDMSEPEDEFTTHDKVGLVLGAVIMVLMLALSAAWVGPEMPGWF